MFLLDQTIPIFSGLSTATHIIVITADHLPIRHIITDAVARFVGIICPVGSRSRLVSSHDGHHFWDHWFHRGWRGGGRGCLQLLLLWCPGAGPDDNRVVGLTGIILCMRQWERTLHCNFSHWLGASTNRLGVVNQYHPTNFLEKEIKEQNLSNSHHKLLQRHKNTDVKRKHLCLMDLQISTDGLAQDCSNSTFNPLVWWCHMVTQIWVNIGSGNGLLPDNTKPLPEQMLTYQL